MRRARCGGTGRRPHATRPVRAGRGGVPRSTQRLRRRSRRGGPSHRTRGTRIAPPRPVPTRAAPAVEGLERARRRRLGRRRRPTRTAVQRVRNGSPAPTAPAARQSSGARRRSPRPPTATRHAMRWRTPTEFSTGPTSRSGACRTRCTPYARLRSSRISETWTDERGFSTTSEASRSSKDAGTTPCSTLRGPEMPGGRWETTRRPQSRSSTSRRRSPTKARSTKPSLCCGPHSMSRARPGIRSTSHRHRACSAGWRRARVGSTTQATCYKRHGPSSQQEGDEVDLLTTDSLLVELLVFQGETPPRSSSPWPRSTGRTASR